MPAITIQSQRIYGEVVVPVAAGMPIIKEGKAVVVALVKCNFLPTPEM
jgi:hypothetical protein